MTDRKAAAISDADRADARVIWDFHQVGHEPRPCSAAITLGSLDLGVASTTANLYHAGMFPVVVFTGDTSAATKERFPRGEAIHYREHALSLGVPDEAILLEPKASNTGQNIGFSREVLENAGIAVTTVLLISMPYMQRRAYATCRKLWPEVEPVCVSQPLAFDEYAKTHDDEKQFIDMLMGDMERVMEYPKRGFAIEQHVPERVRDAFDRLRTRGYDSWLLPA
ncbi:YdcF family protein [Streptomyces sp. NBC_01321]|uniref:YdcF family protein n=1 Tax=Streptomyces sp. NBC_01321 TaxID=2903825 RepID=UPI002E0E83BA|nr:YdcF family protein [Streptomyces sp. NBC_01321]